MLDDLCDELLLKIFSHLPLFDYLRAALICKRFKSLIYDKTALKRRNKAYFFPVTITPQENHHSGIKYRYLIMNETLSKSERKLMHAASECDVDYLMSRINTILFGDLLCKDGLGRRLFSILARINNQRLFDAFYRKCLPEILRAPTNFNPLNWAIYLNQSVDALQNLISQGYKLNSSDGYLIDHTPLAVAILCNRRHLAQHLLCNGARAEEADDYTTQPIHLAVIQNNDGMVELLLDHGVNIDKKNREERTPLCLACINGYVEIANHLITSGADMDISCRRRYTPLHYAILYGYISLANTLISAGACVTAIEKHACTPLFVAAQEGHVNLIQLLLERGAEPSESHLVNPDTLLKIAREKSAECSTRASEFIAARTEMLLISPAEIAGIMGNNLALDALANYHKSYNSM